MKIGDLIDFEFEDVYTGLVVSCDENSVVVYFRSNQQKVGYSHKELENCCWEVISEDR